MSKTIVPAPRTGYLFLVHRLEWAGEHSTGQVDTEGGTLLMRTMVALSRLSARRKVPVTYVWSK